MITIIRTNSENSDFRLLVAELDKDLSIRDGEDHAFFAQFNKIDSLNEVVVAYLVHQPVGCGAIKYYADGAMEVKRMYVPPKFRGKGIASLVLTELEQWSRELGFSRCVLETGKKQPEAIRLYKKNNYSVIPNYGQYEGIDSSICFEKNL